MMNLSATFMLSSALGYLLLNLASVETISFGQTLADPATFVAALYCGLYVISTLFELMDQADKLTPERPGM